jgi:immunoglobulin-binding protein 1
MPDEAPEKSLREVYTEARAKKDQLDDLGPRSSAFKSTLQATVDDLEQCRRLIQDLSIFSPNEELEDLSTQSIQYLTVDYLVAELLQRSYDGNRLAALQRISTLVDNFLTRLDQYSILSAEDRKLFERYQETKARFTLLPTNPEERRRLKIKRFQEEKDLKKKLEVGATYLYLPTMC